MSSQSTSDPIDRPNEGVRLHVPPQPGLTVEARLEDYDAPERRKTNFNSPRDTADFSVIRALVSFEVVASSPVDRFTKPGKLTVCYKQSDVDTAGGANKLKLAAWNGKKWQILPQRPSDECPFPDQDFVGAVEVLITRPWADPPLAWGP